CDRSIDADAERAEPGPDLGAFDGRRGRRLSVFRFTGRDASPRLVLHRAEHVHGFNRLAESPKTSCDKESRVGARYELVGGFEGIEGFWVTLGDEELRPS